MAVSFVAIAVLCICSACALGFSIVFSFFLLMWCGCCRVSDDEDESDTAGRHGNRQDAEDLAITSGAAVAEPERKGIPLNSKPPKLTPEQELLRDKAMEKYKRRKAREERRRSRQREREARAANRREGDYNDHDMMHTYNDYDDDGQSSVTSRTTLTSAATTVRTASTAAYGRGSYLLPPPHLCGVDGDNSEEDDEMHEVRSNHSKSSRRSTNSGKSRASQQGTVASIKNYMRHRQRQRLRRREEQQQIDLFNQWAEAQMASSSELSPSSKSSEASSDGADHHGTRDHHRRTSGARHGGGRAGSVNGAAPATTNGTTAATAAGRGRRSQAAMDSSFNGGYWQAQPRRRSSSVASSAPRPPEEVLGDDAGRYAFLTATHNEEDRAGHREQQHLQAGFPATPNTFGPRANYKFPTEFAALTTPRVGGGGVAANHTGLVVGAEDGGDGGAAVPPARTPLNTSIHVDPQQQQQQQHISTPSTRRPKRTWKDVEHNVALSGFFNSPANNSFGPAEPQYDDGETPAPVRQHSVEPSHSPLE